MFNIRGMSIYNTHNIIHVHLNRLYLTGDVL